MSVPEKMRALQVVELGENYKGVGLHEIAVPKPDKVPIALACIEFGRKAAHVAGHIR